MRWKKANRNHRTLCRDIYFDGLSEQLERQVKAALPFTIDAVSKFIQRCGLRQIPALQLQSYRGATGFYDHKRNLILIDPSLTDLDKWITFIHEAAHAGAVQNGRIFPHHNALFVRYERYLIHRFLLTVSST